VKRNRDNVAAIYIRVSTTKESQRDSPEHQRMLCEEKAKMEGLTIEHVYEDRSSGTNINEREEIRAMLEDAQKGYFSTIIFTSLSRFARDTSDALSLKKKLVNFLKIRLISIEDIYDSALKDDEMIFTIISSVNQKLSEQIALSSRRGIRQSAIKGNFTGSKAPFGYKKVIREINGNQRKSLEIVTEQADIVKKIFDLYVNHEMGEKSIVNYLNSERVPSPKSGEWGYMEKGELFPNGGTWGITTIQRILQNEAYTGRNVFGKYTTEVKLLDFNNLENKKKVLIQKDKKMWERIEEPLWDRIIDDETFKDAQFTRLKRGGGKRGGVRNVKVNPFAGILKCVHCGTNLVSMKSGKQSKRKKNEYRYLICSARRRMGAAGCENGLWIRLDDFRDELLEALKKKLREKINIEEISSTVILPIHKKTVSNGNEQKLIEKQIAANRKLLFELRREFKMQEDGTGSTDDEDFITKEQYLFEKTAYEKEIESLQKKISAIELNKEVIKSDEEIRSRIKLGLEQLANLDFDNIDEMQLILKHLVEKVTVSKDGEVAIYTPLGVLL